VRREVKKEKIGVGLIGFGTVGTGMVKILKGNANEIQRRLGAPLSLVKIADPDLKRDRGIAVPPGLLTTRAEEVIGHPEVDIVVELIGGYEPARTLILQAIGQGKSVVTANKALLAAHGEEIYTAAEKAGVDLGFEGSVGGGIPIIRAMREGLAANRVLSIYGIINGTANYILSKMTEEGRSFAEVLKEAQQKGYAEANPSLDVDGLDTAHKLAILVALAFGTPVDLKAIYTEGITPITPMDIEFAKELGYRIKLLAIAKRDEGRHPAMPGAAAGSGGIGGSAEGGPHGPPDMKDEIEVRVHPTMVWAEEPIATIHGVYNAIYVVGDAVGETLFYGKGAGAMPTGSAVVGDLMEIARNLISGTKRRMPPSGWPSEGRKTLRIRPMEEIETLYYLRFMALDKPGVLSQISGVLGRHNISIASVLQKGRKADGAVPLVMMTHRARERDVRQALVEINELSSISEKTALIRVEGEDEP
jgi:homoserine dehydrogenase